jgi:hypothetical protein
MLGRLKVTRSGMLVGALLSAAIATCDASADIGFARNGPFEACLNGAYDAWVKTQAEYLVNEDPRAKRLDDAAVAAWTSAFQTAFQQYREQSEKVVQRSESMAQHIAETTEGNAKEAARARH